MEGTGPLPLTTGPARVALPCTAAAGHSGEAMTRLKRVLALLSTATAIHLHHVSNRLSSQA